jgi:ADP-ribosylglycohydrolase
MRTMAVPSDEPSDWTLPRPIPETYWLVPGRLLVGEYPGSQSRAEAMERLRRFLVGGITCFVDLTEPHELPSYEALLPFATPAGRRVEYLREPIPDHGVPASRESMARVLAMLDEALEADHVVYLHCRAGVGRSATVAGCWLASRPGRPADALEELQRRWQQSAKSNAWAQIPETEEQAAFVRHWVATSPVRSPGLTVGRSDQRERVRGALLGLAVGDAAGANRGSGGATAGQWTQHTALALCLAESLLECGRFDARDQVGRYLRWQREGHLSATGRPSTATADVARALAAYQWRRQPLAGSHDPRDRSTASLPRVVAAVSYAMADPAAAVSLAGESARTTHQSPFVIDACRYYGAMLVGALRGDLSRNVLVGLYEPAPQLWAARPLKPMVASMARSSAPPAPDASAKKAPAPDVVLAVARARAAVANAADFEDALLRAHADSVEPALDAALAGALLGSMYGARAIPRERVAGLARLDLLESLAARLGAAGDARR